MENTTESSMLILTHGSGMDNETTFLICLDISLPTKSTVEDFWSLESIGISDSPVESDNDVPKKLSNMAMEGESTGPAKEQSNGTRKVKITSHYEVLS